MTCANSGITFFSLAILVLTIWPTILAATTAKWIIIVSALLIIVIVWTGCKCSYCETTSKKKR